MKTITIQFVCPECNERQLSQLREQVIVMERMDRIRVMDKTSPGRKYNADLEGSRTETEGKITGYVCECCGYRLTKKMPPLPPWRMASMSKIEKQKRLNVKSPLDLYRWLREHKMIHENEEILA